MAGRLKAEEATILLADNNTRDLQMKPFVMLKAAPNRFLPQSSLQNYLPDSIPSPFAIVVVVVASWSYTNLPLASWADG